MNKKEEVFLYSYLTILLIIGVIIYNDYGISWDEEISRSNGLFALEYIYSILGLDFNYEIPNIFSNSKQTFREYNDNFYGVVFDLPLGFIEYIFKIELTQNYYFLRHFFNYLIFIIGSYYFFLTLKNFFSFNLSIIGFTMLILTPRIFAESFYNNKDIVFLSFFCIANYYAVQFFLKENIPNLVKFGIAVGLANGVRVAGLIIPMLILFFSVIKFEEKNILQLLKKKIIYCLSILFFIYLFYPYIWENPFHIIDAVSKFSDFDWKGNVFYLGNYEIAKYMPWHYLPLIIIATLPTINIILFFIALIAVLKFSINNFINIKTNDSLLWKDNLQFYLQYNFLIIFAVIFLIIEKNSTIYGGWRQVYFIYPSMIFLSVYGVYLVSNYFANKNKIFISIIYIFLISQVIWIISNHPYQYVYYNYFARDYIKNNFENDYWGVSNKDLLINLDRIKKRNEYKVHIYSASPYEKSLLLMDANIKGKFKFYENINDADYIVSNHYYQDKKPYEEYIFLRNRYKILYEISINKNAINTLYEK